MSTERRLLITVSCGDERCGFCVHRSVLNRFCTLFAEPLRYVNDGSGPMALRRCAECVEAEGKAER
jgi:hypothetical protein